MVIPSQELAWILSIRMVIHGAVTQRRALRDNTANPGEEFPSSLQDLKR